MKRLLLYLILTWIIAGCAQESTDIEDVKLINRTLAKINVSDPQYFDKGMGFDSVVVYAGERVVNGMEEKFKMQLFYFYGDYVRGYIKVPSRDNYNFQLFGRLSNGQLILKCVSTVQSDEQGSFMIIDDNKTGIWSSSHINFVIGTLTANKYNTDYESFKHW